MIFDNMKRGVNEVGVGGALAELMGRVSKEMGADIAMVFRFPTYNDTFKVHSTPQHPSRAGSKKRDWSPPEAEAHCKKVFGFEEEGN